MEADAYQRADRVFTTSEFARKSLIEDYGCPPQRVTAVGWAPNLAADDEGGVGARGHKSKERSVLFVGIDWERKGGPLLVEAFRRLRRTDKNVELRIVGCHPRLRGDGIRVLGRLSPAAVRAEYERASVFCMPSWVEPSAAAYLEAAACGLPVVATRVGATPECVQHGQTGYLCDAGNVECLTESLGDLLDRPDEAQRMGAEGRRIAAQLTWESVAEKIALGISQVL